METKATKKEIRNLVFSRRKECSQEEIEERSLAIAEKIFALPQFRDAGCIYAYMDCKGEASTKEILRKAWALGKRTAVPKVSGEDLIFYYIYSFDDTRPGYFQVPEPVTGKEACEEDAFLIVPGVAFDASCHRCGYGKGFYDKYLSLHTGHRTAAIALDFQIVEEVPSGPHDICPQMVVTPGHIYTSGKL